MKREQKKLKDATVIVDTHFATAGEEMKKVQFKIPFPKPAI